MVALKSCTRKIGVASPSFSSEAVKTRILAADLHAARWPLQRRNSLVRRQRRLHVLSGLLHQLHVQAKRLQFANEYVEALGHARLRRGLAFYDGLVNLSAAVDVVGLGGQQLLQ